MDEAFYSFPSYSKVAQSPKAKEHSIRFQTSKKHFISILFLQHNSSMPPKHVVIFLIFTRNSRIHKQRQHIILKTSTISGKKWNFIQVFPFMSFLFFIFLLHCAMLLIRFLSIILFIFIQFVHIHFYFCKSIAMALCYFCVKFSGFAEMKTYHFLCVRVLFFHCRLCLKGFQLHSTDSYVIN